MYHKKIHQINPKFEALNPKQILNPNVINPKRLGCFGNLNF